MTPANMSEKNLHQAQRDFRIVRGTETDTIWVKLDAPNAFLPTYGSMYAAGMDLRANIIDFKDYYGDQMISDHSIIIAPGCRKLVKTGISVAVPRDTYARIAPRSGLAVKHGIDTMAGVVDCDYRGDVGVLLYNAGDAGFEVEHGMRIAQLVVEKIKPCLIVEATDLSDTARGEGGFGSTGTH